MYRQCHCHQTFWNGGNASKVTCQHHCCTDCLHFQWGPSCSHLYVCESTSDCLCVCNVWERVSVVCVCVWCVLGNSGSIVNSLDFCHLSTVIFALQQYWHLYCFTILGSTSTVIHSVKQRLLKNRPRSALQPLATSCAKDYKAHSL